MMIALSRKRTVWSLVLTLTVLIFGATTTGRASLVSGSSGDAVARITYVRATHSAAPPASPSTEFSTYRTSDKTEGPSAKARCAWSIVKSPNGSGGSTLDAVDAASPTDGWAVGAHGTFNFYGPPGYHSTSRTLVEHFDGKRWSIIKGPGGRNVDGTLTGVSAVSGRDVWAVGWGVGTRGYYFIIIEHYNGRRWSVIKAPQPFQATLSSVTALSADDVWAVGSSDKYGLLTDHYNGKTWSLSSRRAFPVPGQVDFLDNAPTDVSAVSTNDIWVAGEFLGGKKSFGPHTLTEHYNGKRWALVRSPNPPDTGAGQLLAVSAGAGNDVWAVGFDDDAVGSRHSRWLTRPLVEHYDGRHWIVTATPAVSWPSLVLHTQRSREPGKE
jgi:hypothetical protein